MRLRLSRWLLIALIFMVASNSWLTWTAEAADSISKLVLSKNELTLQVGDTATLTATAVYTSGTTETATVKTDWNSGSSDIATVYAGVVTAKSEGKAVITATYLGKTEIVNVTVTKKVKSLTKDKQSLDLRLGKSEQLLITAYYDDGTTEDVTSKADYSISESSIVTVTNGLVKGQSPGSTLVTIKYANQTLTLPVDVEIVKRVDAEKSNVSLLLNGTQKIKLMATYPDGTVADVSADAEWTSDKESVADALKGTITGYGAGTATITASYGTKSTTIKVDVDATLKLDLDKQDLLLKKGTTGKLKLTATYADGTIKDVTDIAEWTSSNSNVYVTKGILSANSIGEAVITAKYGDKSVTANVDVEVPRRLEVNQDQVSMQAGKTQQLTLTATFADGTTKDVTNDAAWTVDNDSVAYVNKGKITAYKAGSAKVTATYSGKTTTTKVEVDIPNQIKPSKKIVNLQAGGFEQITLTAVYKDGREEDVTSKADWTSSSDTIAEVSGGYITGLATGSATVTAKYGSRTATVQVSVGVLKTLVADQEKLILKKGNTASVKLTATYTDETTKTVTSDAIWSTSNANIATVSSGTIKAIASGETTIMGQLDSKTVTITVQVDMASALAANPMNIVMDLNETRSIVLTATDLVGADRDVTSEADWKTSNSAVAQVSKGKVTPVARGKVTITATFGGKSVSIPVEIGVISNLEADQRFVALKRGGQVQLKLTATLSDGTQKDVTNSASWKSQNYKVADVKNGLVSAIGSGKTLLTATFGGRTITVPVENDVLKYLKTDVVKVELQEGKTYQVSALATYNDSSEDDVTKPALWTSSNIMVADVKDGVIKATGKGTAKITVTYSNMKTTVLVTVTK